MFLYRPACERRSIFFQCNRRLKVPLGQKGIDRSRRRYHVRDAILKGKRHVEYKKRVGKNF